VTTYKSTNGKFSAPQLNSFLKSRPFQGIGRKERRPQADSLDFSEHVFYILLVGLGTLVRQRETVRLHSTFPTERSGSR
jgi:hypothetical protein